MSLITSLSPALLCVAVLSIIIRWLINYYKIISRLPPGPWGLPLLGYLPYLSKLSYLTFIELGKKYGGMFSIGLGTNQYVVLNDWPSVKATIVDRSKIFSGRGQNIITTTFSQDKDIAFTDGEIWKKQRQVVSLGMKVVGMSKKSIEGHFVNMIDGLIEKLNKCIGRGIDLEPIFSVTYYDANWKLISSFDVVENKAKVKQFAEDILNFIEGLSGSNPLHYISWLRFVPPNGFGYWKYRRSVKRIQRRVRNLIKKHKTKIPFDESMLAFHSNKNSTMSEKGPPYQDDYLLATIFVLFGGSYATILSTTLMAIFYLCKYPDIQENIQKELDKVVGRNRVPSFSDIKDLLQLETFILETHRISSIVPLSIPHKALETVEINGHTIPKGTICLENIYAIHHDPQLWDEPEEFKPERFLNHENKIQIPPYYMPFSLGPRICLGQPFAEMELRLVFANLLQKFTFSFPKNQPPPPLIMLDGLSTIPAPFPVVSSIRE